VADPKTYQQALIDAGARCAQAAEAAVVAALATAGLLDPAQLPPGMEMPTKNLTDAAAIASLANNAASAAHDIAQALDLLQARPVKLPEGDPPSLYPTAATATP
jgi:hypothetical protein